MLLPKALPRTYKYHDVDASQVFLQCSSVLQVTDGVCQVIKTGFRKAFMGVCKFKQDILLLSMGAHLCAAITASLLFRA